MQQRRIKVYLVYSTALIFYENLSCDFVWSLLRLCVVFHLLLHSGLYNVGFLTIGVLLKEPDEKVIRSSHQINDQIT